MIEPCSACIKTGLVQMQIYVLSGNPNKYVFTNYRATLTRRMVGDSRPTLRMSVSYGILEMK